MESKNIGIIAVILIVLGGLFVWGYAGKGATTASVQGSSATNVASALSTAETLYDFGVISMRDGTVTNDFTVTNPTDRDMTVSALFTSCMCTTAYFVLPDGNVKGPFGMSGMGYIPPVDEVMKAGESRIVRVVYDPNAHGPAGVGRIDRFVTLTDDSGGTIEFEIKANVTP